MIRRKTIGGGEFADRLPESRETILLVAGDATGIEGTDGEDKEKGKGKRKGREGE